MVGILQDALVYLGSFVVVLSVVVFVHEYGHFRVGRWCGMAVKSFSIGLGGEWLGWTDKHGTRWKISRIPLGGFVSWVDDTDGSSTRPATEEDQSLSPEEARARGHFRAMPVWKRALTVAAGPAANFIFAVLAFALLALVLGRDDTDPNTIPARLAQIAPNSAAATAGLRPGDVIRSVDGVPTPSFTELQHQISVAGGRSVTLEVVRGSGEQLTVNATPQQRGDRALLGVSGPLVLESERVIVPNSPVEALGVGFASTWRIVSQTVTYIGAVFSGRESGDQIAGPLGIINVSGQVASSAIEAPETGFWQKFRLLLLSLLSLAAMLSVAVGFVNLLPVPVLDGGHLVLYAAEAVRGGRPLPPVVQEWAYRAGFAVIGSLFLFATWNDIARLFPGAQ